MLVRVFELPDLRTNGFLHGGGQPSSFLQVDWFTTEGGPDFATAEGRETAAEFIRAKRYFKADRAFLVLHPTHPFTINYSAP